MATISQAFAIALEHHRAGRLELAAQVYERILAVEPSHADALHLLGLIAHQLGKHEIAVQFIGRAIALKPTDAEFHNNLGEAYRALGRTFEAADCYRRALELEPDFVEAHNNLGNVLRDQGKLDEAVACCRRALELRPDYAKAYNNLGNALGDLGKLDEAVACFRRALQFGPDSAEAHNNLGVALKDLGRLDEAAACFRRALELKPDFAEAHGNLGVTLQNQGRLDEAVACWRHALRLKPDFAAARSNLLLTLHYCDGVTPKELAEAEAEFDQKHAAPLRSAWRPFANLPDADRTLRLGFVSPDFGRHPVGYLYLRALEGLRGQDCRIACYSTRTRPDEFTARFRTAADIWREAPGISDDALARQIRDDAVDILFELTSHAAGNRLLVFARKPAPIQIAWAGPTGLSAMDYLLADSRLVPADAEMYYRENVLRMPDFYACFGPPAEAPQVGPLPALARGYVTFGSFNNPTKITPQVIAVWSQILRRLPASRLLIRYYSAAASPGTRGALSDGFAAGGIARSRVDFLDATPHDKRLDAYNEIDLALDPFPFTGCLTTCEALWQGVPVITLPGPTFFSRQSLSVLRSVGFEASVARDPEDYVQRALALAQDLPRLAQIRAGLRRRVAESPLCDANRFAENLMKILRRIWREWCRRQSPTA